MRPPCSSIPGVFTLRRIGKLVALTASEDAPAIDYRNTLAAPTGRAEVRCTAPIRTMGGVCFWATSFCQVLRLIPIAEITSATVMS